MANFRQIHVSIWKDPWFLELAPEEKTLFIYLFSNESTSLAGIYEISLRVISFETGLAIDFVKKSLNKFQDAGKVLYQDGVLWVKNLRKYNASSSEKVQIRIENDIDNVPDCFVKDQYIAYYYPNIEYAQDIDTLSHEEEEEINKTGKITGNGSAADVSGSFHDHSEADAIRLYRTITDQMDLPRLKSDQIIADLITVLDYYNGVDPKKIIDDGKVVFARWCSTKSQKGKFYSKLNPTWITWWLEELAPVPELDREELSQDIPRPSSLCKTGEILARKAVTSRGALLEYQDHIESCHICGGMTLPQTLIDIQALAERMQT